MVVGASQQGKYGLCLAVRLYSILPVGQSAVPLRRPESESVEDVYGRIQNPRHESHRRATLEIHMLPNPGTGRYSIVPSRSAVTKEKLRPQLEAHWRSRSEGGGRAGCCAQCVE